MVYWRKGNRKIGTTQILASCKENIFTLEVAKPWNRLHDIPSVEMLKTIWASRQPAPAVPALSRRFGSRPWRPLLTPVNLRRVEV